jgi:hypothetical protein
MLPLGSLLRFFWSFIMVVCCFFPPLSVGACRNLVGFSQEELMEGVNAQISASVSCWSVLGCDFSECKKVHTLVPNFPGRFAKNTVALETAAQKQKETSWTTMNSNWKFLHASTTLLHLGIF